MPTVAEPRVPAHLLRYDPAYRTLPRGRDVRLGAGFLLKSGRIEDHTWPICPQYSAVWCLRGSGEYRDHDGRVFPVRTGTLFHRFHGRQHRNTLTPGCHWAEAWIHLPNEVADGLLAVGALDHRRPVQHPGIDLALVEELSAMVAVVREAPESELPRVLAELVRLLAILTTRDAQEDHIDPQRHLIDRACQRLSTDHRVDLDDLARELGLSYERFRKIFRERMGVSPGEYRIRRRIDRARALLQQRSLAIKAIANELGYPNPYAFSAQFKTAVGESPAAYRKRH